MRRFFVVPNFSCKKIIHWNPKFTFIQLEEILIEFCSSILPDNVFVHFENTASYLHSFLCSYYKLPIIFFLLTKILAIACISGNMKDLKLVYVISKEAHSTLYVLSSLIASKKLLQE